MKKALAILMVLAVVAGAAFADTYGNEAAVSVSGDATLTWGIDLDADDKQANGFKNAENWEVKIPLLSKQSFTHKSEGDNYAEITIADAQSFLVSKEDADAFVAGDNTVDNLTAKLVFGAVYVVIEDKPGFKTNNAQLFAPIKNDSWGDSDEEGDLTFEPGFDVVGGTKIGYKTEKFDVAAKIGSFNNWETAGKSQYAVGVDASVTPSDMITASATLNYGMKDRATTSDEDGEFASGVISAGAKVVAKPVEGLTATVALDAGNDYVATDADGEAYDVFAMDVLASVAYKFVEAGVYYASVATPFASNVDADSGLKIAGFDKEGVAIADAAAYLKLTDGDMVENLDAWFTVMAYSFLSDPKYYKDTFDVDVTAPISIGTGASYKIVQNDVNYIKPFFSLYAQNMSHFTEEPTDWIHCGEVGADYGLFTNTVVTAKYAAGGTQDNMSYAMIATPANSTKGVFTLACKVTY